MNRKTIIILILLILVSSCGKKDDPEYKANKKIIPLLKVV